MKLAAAMLLILCLLTGCSANQEPLNLAMDLRNALIEGNGCTFTAVITADYGDRIHTFSMDCITDGEGNLNFTLTDPETISGITGRFTQGAGTLTFDDSVLAFPLLADGQLAPVCTPWIFMRTLRSGYISGYAEENDKVFVYYDDSFENAVLNLEVLLDQDNMPLYTEISWNQRRILSAQIRDFAFL